MPYRIKSPVDLSSDIQRIAEEQIDRGIAEIDDRSLDRHQAVHQVRKRCKKVRAVLRFARAVLEEDDIYRKENVWYRDAAREISDVRDAQALIETYDRVMEHFGDQVNRAEWGEVRGRLVERRNEIAGQEVKFDARLSSVRAKLAEGRERVGEWSALVSTAEDLLPGLGKSYGRGRKAMAAAYEHPGPERFHEWRKRAKYHWYHCRLLEDMWPPVMKARIVEADRVSDLLGNEHDLSVFLEILRQEGDEFGDDKTVVALSGLLEGRRTELRDEVKPIGERLFAEKRKHLERRLGSYWAAWQSERL